MIKSFRNFLHYTPLLFEFVKRELKLKYRRSVLGYLWSLLNPLIMMLIVSAVFSFVFRGQIENFAAYLIIGQTFYAFLNESTTSAMRALIDNSSLLQKVYIPKYVFPFARILSALVNLLYSMIAIVIVIIFTHVKVTSVIVFVPLGLLYLVMFCAGIGLIVSIATAYFRDMLHLYPLLLLAWMYLTPIFYSVQSLSEQMQRFARMNPMYWYVTYFRKIILWAEFPTLTDNLICFGWGIAMLAVGLFFFKRTQDKVMLHI